MKCYANEIIIHILIEEPNITKNFDCKNYSMLQENYFLKLNNKDPDLQNIHLNFFCYKNNTDFRESYNDFITKQTKISNYDMIIVDERYLFSDMAFIESTYVNSRDNKNSFLENYIKINIYNNDIFNYHNSDAIKKGCLNGYDLYGYPYEQDFSLIYYDNNNINLENKNMYNTTWEDLLLISNHSNIKNQNPINIALKNDDELLDIFIEYACSKFDTTIDDNNFESILYSDKSYDLYNSFHSFIIKSSISNLSKIFEKTNNDIYNSFINKEATLLKGKASHYKYLVHDNVNKKFSVSLPPKNMSVINTKYVIINKNSNYSENILKKVALKLTSEEMQIFRAENFGNIPTFDISKKEKNAFINKYCQKNQELCKIMINLRKINIKDTFKGKYSPPFKEIRLLLPQAIKNFLTGSSYNYISNIFENIKTLVIDNSNRRDIINTSLKITQSSTIVASLIPLILYPVEAYSSNNDSRLSQYINAPDISLFIKTKKKNQKFDKKSKTNQSFATINEDGTTENFDDDDIFENNPNNIFFNQSLQMISDQENSTI
ncbi:hypothetical protein PIROE2DRAFT_15254 [Piromyces sp. E2]|nr:hypothetical protein PIROE2DRAFT_15254 [Piromyces sp. E2]|eukprot:OUM59260.1 hypothetical protein PIROE2DRAFT_15254 [Piromyces sp. E2]